MFSKETSLFLQQNKSFNKGAYEQLLKIHTQSSIPLYHVGTISKWIFLFSRYQVMGYCIGIILQLNYISFNLIFCESIQIHLLFQYYIRYIIDLNIIKGCSTYALNNLYQKYVMYKRLQNQNDPQDPLYDRKNELIQSKFKMIYALGAFLSLSSVFGVFFSLKMGKRLPKSITYDIKDNKIIVNQFSLFGLNSPIVLSPSDFSTYDNSVNRFDKTVEFQYKVGKGFQKLSTHGPGNWNSKALFKYLIN